MIGFAIGAATNVIQQGIASNWTFKNFNWGSLLADALVGGALGAFTFGLASAPAVFAGKVLVSAGVGAFLNTWAKGISGQDPTLSDFAISFASSAVSMFAGAGLSGLGSRIPQVASFANSLGGQMAFGGLMGGATSAALGGNFFEGFATGAIVAGMWKLAGKLAANSSTNVPNAKSPDETSTAGGPKIYVKQPDGSSIVKEQINGRWEIVDYIPAPNNNKVGMFPKISLILGFPSLPSVPKSILKFANKVFPELGLRGFTMNGASSLTSPASIALRKIFTSSPKAWLPSATSFGGQLARGWFGLTIYGSIMEMSIRGYINMTPEQRVNLIYVTPGGFLIPYK